MKLGPSADAAAAGAEAGDGVDGAFDVKLDKAGAGAVGTAGVCAVAGEGVEGAFEVEEEAVGAALGYDTIRLRSQARTSLHLTFDIMQTMNPFSSMLYDSTVFESCKIFPVHVAHDQRNPTWMLAIHKKMPSGLDTYRSR